MKDYNHTLKDSGAVTTSAAGTVDGEAKIADLGAGKVEGKMVVDVTAIEIASDNESYEIELQGSSESDFASTIEVLASMKLGAAEVLDGDQDSTTGRYEIAFTTLKHGTTYQYVREYCTCNGSVSTGITFSAHLVA